MLVAGFTYPMRVTFEFGHALGAPHTFDAITGECAGDRNGTSADCDWYWAADLNRDLGIDVAGYAILSGNYGEVGD